MSQSLADIQLAERHYDQLAADMIALLRTNGDDKGADFAQTMLDEDGSGTAVNACVIDIIDHHIDPTPVAELFKTVHTEFPGCNEDYQDFLEYMQNFVRHAADTHSFQCRIPHHLEISRGSTENRTN
ncbi:hypothetical protein JS532_00570 [Bifidobacterium callimiconis]|uniref:hypothetical protein n=1 Tax=Bifidobacterium callimiconis TaxID=2306973 RepID=UPI001BDDB624|nr:hypothetical protein [Bifidobacterium callimiconis]MBT1176064.1 hypothetical protein [Bifidobacterium callimiconis]